MSYGFRVEVLRSLRISKHGKVQGGENAEGEMAHWSLSLSVGG